MTLNTLARYARTMIRAGSVIGKQQEIIRDQRALIDKLLADMQEQSLAHARDTHGLVCGWLIHCESPEIDLRPELAEFERKLGGEIARLEEHVL